MPINADKPHLWKADIARSVDFYNDWFMSFAPEAYRTQRVEQTQIVEIEMRRTNYLRNISPGFLKEYPSVFVPPTYFYTDQTGEFRGMSGGGDITGLFVARF